MKTFDVVVLGGGAAGLMCAISAGQRGRRVLVLEGSNRVGKKILMSGGGRCNFTNLYCEPGNFLSANPSFCKSALSRYTQWDFVTLVQRHGIAYHEKTAGQLFCDQSSKQIVAMLLAECGAAGVQILTGINIKEVAHDGCYRVRSETDSYQCESLVIATGGLSIPKMGASGYGYELARQFGLNVLETRAGLVPFTLTGVFHDVATRLSGTSALANVAVDSTTFTDNILFTHRGLSGPAALQISSYWTPGNALTINLYPEIEIARQLQELKRERPRSLLRTVLSDSLPRALVVELQALLWPRYMDTPLAELSDDRLRRIGDNLSSWSLRPAGTEGYRTAEVTLGGVDTRELSSRTMEARRQKGLYCIGEVVDVTGHLGGFNFQWAWASGFAAGKVA